VNKVDWNCAGNLHEIAITLNAEFTMLLLAPPSCKSQVMQTTDLDTTKQLLTGKRDSYILFRTLSAQMCTIHFI